jgi:phage tail sheath protein FI
VACNNWTEFRNRFANGENLKSTWLSHAVYGFFLNQGSRCFIVNIKEGEPLANGLQLLEANDEVSIIVAPGYTDPASHEAVRAHCEKRSDRICIHDAPTDVASVELFGTVETAAVSAKPKAKDKDATAPAAAAPADKPPEGLLPKASSFATLYYPCINVVDPLDPDGAIVSVFPSGHVAGVMARVDAKRGVHKAPANEALIGAVGVKRLITPEEHGMLNPLGVNCIRIMPLEGPKIMGGRTLAGDESEWRYVNVRRLFIMIEQSILRYTQFAVYEPNDRTLWKTLKSVITRFLTHIWSDGALMGRTADEAFFVKCDEETNPQESIDLGQVITVIGIAPVKPAEFIIFKIAQTHEGAKAETL